MKTINLHSKYRNRLDTLVHQNISSEMHGFHLLVNKTIYYFYDYPTNLITYIKPYKRSTHVLAHLYCAVVIE